MLSVVISLTKDHWLLRAEQAVWRQKQKQGDQLGETTDLGQVRDDGGLNKADICSSHHMRDIV